MARASSEDSDLQLGVTSGASGIAGGKESGSDSKSCQSGLSSGVL